MIEPYKKTIGLLESMGYKKIRAHRYARIDCDLIYYLQLPTGKGHCRVWHNINVLTDPFINFNSAIKNLGGWFPKDESDLTNCKKNSPKSIKNRLHDLVAEDYKHHLSKASGIDSWFELINWDVDRKFVVFPAFWMFTLGRYDQALKYLEQVKVDMDYLYNPHGDREKEMDYYLSLKGSKTNINSIIDETLEENRIENVYKFKLNKFFPSERFGRKSKVAYVFRDEY